MTDPQSVSPGTVVGLVEGVVGGSVEVDVVDVVDVVVVGAIVVGRAGVEDEDEVTLAGELGTVVSLVSPLLQPLDVPQATQPVKFQQPLKPEAWLGFTMIGGNARPGDHRCPATELANTWPSSVTRAP